MNSSGDLLFWMLLGLAILAGLAVVGRLAGPRPKILRKPFLTDNEKRVLALLEAALPTHRIMAQVAMGALLRAGDSDRRRAQATRNRFDRKIVDFVVVTRDTAEVVAIVELDDRTHRAEKDKSRDAMTIAAGYRTIRIPSRPQPNAQSVAAAVADLRSLAPAPSAARAAR